jgi:hypothetical protein
MTGSMMPGAPEGRSAHAGAAGYPSGHSGAGGNGLAFTKPQLMAAAKEFEQDSLSLQAIEKEADRQVRSGDLLSVPVSPETACSCWSHASRTTLKKHYPPRP